MPNFDVMVFAASKLAGECFPKANSHILSVQVCWFSVSESWEVGSFSSWWRIPLASGNIILVRG